MTSLLWDNQYLTDFAEELRLTPTIQFWECDTDGNVMDFKPHHYKKMLNRFFPAFGVANLQLGQTEKGKPTSTLVFCRGNRVEQIDPQTLKQITYKLFNLMGNLGVDIRTNFYKEKVFNKDELGIVPDLEGKKVFQDNALSAYRFFQNGYVEITENGVSQLKPYTDIPDEYVIWNSSVIPKDYEDTITKEVLEQKLQGILTHLYGLGSKIKAVIKNIDEESKKINLTVKSIQDDSEKPSIGDGQKNFYLQIESVAYL